MLRAWARASWGKRLMSSSRKTATQLGSRPTTGIPASISGSSCVEDFQQQAFGAVEHAEVVEGASAAEVGARDDDAESGGFEDFDGGIGGAREEIVVEGVGPEEDVRASSQGLKPHHLSALDAALKRHSSTPRS